MAYRQIWPADWIVGVHLPIDQAEAPLITGIQQISYFAWWMMALTLPFIITLIWFALRPLARIAEQVTELRDQQRHRLEISTQMPELRRIIDVINETELARMNNLRDLSRREALLNATLKSSPQGMFITDSQGQITFINEAVYEAVGPSASEKFATWFNRIHSEDRDPIWSAWTQSFAQQQEFTRQFRFMDHADKQRWVVVHARMIHVNDEFIGAVGVIRDITQQRQEDKQRRWEAEHDPLTGSLNRRGLMRRLEEALIDWQKSGFQSAVLVFDLDNLKRVNDQGGHALGDLMLKKVAETTRNIVRSSDHVARLGGDEFVVLLNGCSLDRAFTLAEELCERIASDVKVQQEGVWNVTASIGVSSFQPGDKTIDEVLARGDIASYSAKRGGRNRVVVSS